MIATTGVHSINLNGFDLTQTTTPGTGANNSNTGIFLYGGVHDLSFHDIIAPNDTSQSYVPIDVVIGDPNTPLKTKASISFASIQNTVFDSANTVAPPPIPQTTPTVNLLVNGQIGTLSFVSTTQATVSAADQYLFPTVATTGRTAVQAQGIDHLNVRGSAINFTASRSSTPFQNGLSGLDHLGTASFGGNADAVGLDVRGPIGKLRFERGLGNPIGTNGTALHYGTPAANIGYPGNGLLGGLVTARKIGAVRVGPANTINQTPQNPNFSTITSTGNPNYYPQPGNALTSAAIVSSGKIGTTAVRGNISRSEIKAGFDYPSYVAGLQGTRSPSTIKPVAVHGDLINGVVSSTFRPGANVYNSPLDQKGPGAIKGNLGRFNNLYSTGATTPLNDTGTGFYARVKRGYLPPPAASQRVKSVQVR